MGYRHSVLALFAITAMLAGTGIAWGQQMTNQGPQNLRTPPSDSIVTRAGHCPGYFRLDFRDGKRLDVPEIHLRIKIDTSQNGPPAGTMVKLRSGMTGDRASLVFSSVADLKRLLQEGCENQGRHP